MYLEGYGGDRHLLWRENQGLAGQRLIYSVAACFVIILAFASLLAERDRDLIELQVALRLYQSPTTKAKALHKLDVMAPSIINAIFKKESHSREIYRYYEEALSKNFS